MGRGPTDWVCVSGRPFLHGPGSALSWHRDDHALYRGAYIYYAHPMWKAAWGGELLLSDAPTPLHRPRAKSRRTSIFSRETIDAPLEERGCGYFVSPKPNRIVFIGDAVHSVARVSPAIGEAQRASIAGFFHKELPVDLKS